MRLWSIHPSFLDAKGLVALWREGLLAQAVLLGNTKGYTKHPQLNRFRDTSQPASMIGAYLYAVYTESITRGYSFDVSKIHSISSPIAPIEVTTGQLVYELEHLRSKLIIRSPNTLQNWSVLRVNNVFKVIPGNVERWEKVTDKLK